MLDNHELLNARILVVDDQEANVLLLEQMLRNSGYTDVDTTQDPRQVEGMHRAKKYDLILLDLQMPELDGFEVMEALKGLELGAYLPVLVITAQPGHKLRALAAGAKDFVGKPFDMIEVQTRIRNMLEVRLLYQRLAGYNTQLENMVEVRTAQLKASEARFQRFTELSSDWFWEQDANGTLTWNSGPVAEMLGIGAGGDPTTGGWHPDDRALLEENIRERKPFLNFVCRRHTPDGGTQYLQISGEPMFDNASRFSGYRGIGMDITEVVENLTKGKLA
jgi:PAS domain S-box-containing protein